MPGLREGPEADLVGAAGEQLIAVGLEWIDDGDDGGHEHEWGPVQRSLLSGNPHRKCQVPYCRFITLDLADDDEAEAEVA